MVGIGDVDLFVRAGIASLHFSLYKFLVCGGYICLACLDGSCVLSLLLGLEAFNCVALCNVNLGYAPKTVTRTNI
jgi:hypothetical protein